MITLNNWSLRAVDPHKAPELQTPRLYGEVYGHPRFKDGKQVITSRVVSINEDETLITKSGSKYTLGYVDPNYEEAFPDARNRLLTQIKKVTAKVN